MREICKLKSMPAPKFRYQSMIKAGPFYYTAGMIGLDEQGALIQGGVQAQAEKILKDLGNALEELGLTKEHLLSAKIYMADMAEFAEVNKVWEIFFPLGQEEPPVRTSIGVAALPLNARVEMEFVLYRP